MSYQHQPVMLDECIKGLEIKPDGIYFDGTFGRGGHSRAILDCLNDEGRLIAMDKDIAAIECAKETFSEDPRFEIHHGSFATVKELLSSLGLLGRLDGMLLDLGVSSPQLDDAERGFSFLKTGPLDMRMDQTSGQSAREWLAQVSERELADVLFQYGEERYSRRIAKAIIREREQATITQTDQLAKIVKEAHPKWEKHKHPATRSFQAIRIYINRELEDINQFLQTMMDCLQVGGRIVFLSFHSLEDRLVKRALKKLAVGDSVLAKLPIPESETGRQLKIVGKAAKAKLGELDSNIRARSAVLRIGEKIA
jgi:16S rRNA (cytosine1402-N4)-methyltransferase